MNDFAISKENLSIRTYHAIRRGLMSGRYQPGQKLLLRNIADELEISITPVREALLQLTAEQALIADTSRSLTVPVLTKERFLEIQELRVDLEGRAAAEATRKIGHDVIDQLELLHGEVADSKVAGDFAKTLISNERFHFTLYRAAEKPVLYRIIESLWVQIGPIMNHLYDQPPTGERSEHLVVLKGLRLGDAEMARDAIRRDIMFGSRVLSAKLARDEAAKEEIVKASGGRARAGNKQAGSVPDNRQPV